MSQIHHNEGDCHACIVNRQMNDSRLCEGCADELLDNPDAYHWITVMRGDDLSRKERIWFGWYETPIHKRPDDLLTDDLEVRAEPVEQVPLPRPMERDEIEDWLEQDDRAEDYLEMSDSPSAKTEKEDR